MAEYKRTPSNISEQRNIGNGPFLARIVSHLDPTFMGSLEVTLLRHQANIASDDTQTYIVRCASPFFGYTGFEFMGQNTATTQRTQGEQALNQQGVAGASTIDAFNDTQKSYGMWMVPPDVGVNVLVVFIDGDPSQGYWIACVPSRFANHMVPALAGSTEVDLDSADKQKLNWPNKATGLKMPLPVAEVNRRLNQKEQNSDVDKIKKPLHPIAEKFLEQGLLEDDVRGVTTSSSRREAPSMVFGISTPGPLDRRQGAKKSRIGTLQSPSPSPVPVSRLGGTTLVMDDGDDRYRRETSAGTGPVKYIDVIAEKDKPFQGDPTIPYNEYFRVRTRTGHQILMHNSEDLIYIGNAKGTTWIELTSNGKIDIYAQDSISIHTENDLNIKANRDINLEAGRNINIRSEIGRLHMDVATDWKVTVGQNNKITVGKDCEHVVGGNTKITTSENFDLGSGGYNRFTASGNTDIRSGGNHTESAARIDMNGPLAQAAVQAVEITPLNLHANPSTSTQNGWDAKYQGGNIASIMKRIPMHEPWVLHENQTPQFLTPTNTDREI